MKNTNNISTCCNDNCCDACIYVTTVNVSCYRTTLPAGESCFVRATPKPDNATNKKVVWSSSNNAIATVNPDSGLVTGQGVGTAVITATAVDRGIVTGTYVIEIVPYVFVQSLTVLNPELTMHPDGRKRVDILMTPSNATNFSVKWCSSNECVATVDGLGVVKTHNVGEAIITVRTTDGSNLCATCRIIVEAVPVEAVTIESTSENMNVGDEKEIVATICPENATNKTVTWCSSNENVATVGTYTGKVTAHKAGTAEIVATTVDGNFVARCTVNVCQVLTGADLYIDDENIRDTIINAKNLLDATLDLYLSGTISECQFQEMQEEIQYTIDLARADYIVVNDQSDFAYQYFKNKNYQNGDVSPFDREITYNEDNPVTGLDIMVIQRGMQAVGWFEPDENYRYGVYDSETFSAALNNNVLLNGIFDQGAYRIIFSIETSSFRTPQWLIDLEKFSMQHKLTQIALAARAAAQIEVTIKNGGPSGTHAGRADVLKDYGTFSHIWEIKHQHNKNLAKGDNQLKRYKEASDAYAQNFTIPLLRGYDFDTFYVQIPNNPQKCLEVTSTSVAGLVFYSEIEMPSPQPSFVAVPFPQTQKKYEYQLETAVKNALGNMAAAVVTIAAIAGLIYVTYGGILIPLSEYLRLCQQQVFSDSFA